MNIAAPESVAEMLGRSSPVAVGVSGGKDSCALALATSEYLDAIGHAGPRILIHADLGSVEWSDSLPTCERLAERLGVELVVVRRTAGGMMQRWQQRWRNNVERYRTLSCMRLILPWSTASMRFCTSELKVAVITSELRRRFGGSTILSATGIRRDESSARAKAVAVKPQKRLLRSSDGTSGFDWNPLLDWSKADVLDFLAERGFELHEAYRTFGSSRVSCAFCVLGSQGDLRAAARCEGNHAIYREMVALEGESAFAFQQRSWLGDVAPELLDDSTRSRIAHAKEIQRQRESVEERIPRHLLYTAGWPNAVPTASEAEIIAEVRCEVAALYGWSIDCTDALSVVARHEELLALKLQRLSEATS